jgi:hypothetical protein
MSVLPDSSMAELNVLGLPVHMQYSQALNTSAVSGKRRKVKIYPQGNNSYSPSSNQAVVNMNFGVNDLLDTSTVQLNFTLSLVGGTTNDCYLDTSAYGLINRVQTRDNSGQVIDQIVAYNDLVHNLFTVQASKSAMDSSAVHGFPHANGLGVLATGDADVLDLAEIPGNQSYKFTAGAGSASFSLPILCTSIFSAHLNNNQSYLPVSLLNGNAIQVEFQFETVMGKILKSTTATGFPTGYTITNLFIECAVTEVDPSVIREFKNMIGQQELYISSQMWSNVQYTPSNAVSTYNVNASGRSIRSLLVSPQATIGATSASVIASAKYPVKSFQTQVNSEYVPSFPLTSIPELIDETSAALGVSRANGMMNAKSFGTAYSATFTTTAPLVISRCPVGIDYDRFKDSSKEQGIKAQNGLITVNLETSAQAGIINNWVLQDCVLGFNPMTGTLRNIYQ